MSGDFDRRVEYHLDGRVVLVTGVSRSVGIGAGIARRLAAEGAALADPAAPAAVMAAAVEALGHADALVANQARGVAATLEELDAAEIDLPFAVNARVSVLLVKEFAAQHDGRPGGRVVLFTSGQHLGPMPGELPYVISKGAIQQMTASLARHLAPRGITVNCINPGPTDTAASPAESGVRSAEDSVN
jgi:3-oxoacyl-[acyl-carrier protein] reductase